MNYDESLEYIHSLERFGIMPGLERISKLCEKLGNPQEKLKIIHVAGTNGKGSTCTVCSNILRAAGYKTGLYISPYVTDFRERIQIDGEMISKEDLADCADIVKNTASEYEIKVTEFEFITAVAFLYFSRRECDYAVFETGLGGRLDATNVVSSPLACVLTCISLDHTEILGDTVEKIAAEKCGIIKRGAKVISYPYQLPEVSGVIDGYCARNSTVPIIPDVNKIKVKWLSVSGNEFTYGGLYLTLPLPGEHMVFNAVTAVEAVRAVLPDISDDAVSRGVAASVMPARLELISSDPLVILDGGHNEDCASALKNYINSVIPGRRITAVCSIMADKDYKKYLETVLPCFDSFTATKAGVPRALSSEELADLASRLGIKTECIPDPVEAVKNALDNQEGDSAVIVCGSFYLAGEVRNYMIERLKK